MAKQSYRLSDVNIIIFISAIEGYFRPDGDDLYDFCDSTGREYPRYYFNQYLHVTFTDGRWQAVSIVGNSGTPRGFFSWRISEEDTEDISQPTSARYKVGNGQGSSSEDTGTVRYDPHTDKWFVWNFNSSPCPFSRVTEVEALEAEKNPDFTFPY